MSRAARLLETISKDTATNSPHSTRLFLGTTEHPSGPMHWFLNDRTDRIEARNNGGVKENEYSDYRDPEMPASIRDAIYHKYPYSY